MKIKQRETLKEEFVAEIGLILRPLGYELGPTIPYGTADLTLWFFRRGGKVFVSEAICVRLQWADGGRFFISFFGSPLVPEELHWLSGNVGGWSLFFYQTSVLERSPKKLLPQEIELGSKDRWPKLFKRLQQEISEVDTRIWADLAAAWIESEKREGRL